MPSTIMTFNKMTEVECHLVDWHITKLTQGKMALCKRECESLFIGVARKTLHLLFIIMLIYRMSRHQVNCYIIISLEGLRRKIKI
jgi:hypothetical protein